MGMKNTLEEIKKWLDQEPEPSDVTESPEGGLHIPIDKLKPLLTELDPMWGTKNFKGWYTDLGNGVMVNGTVELTIRYGMWLDRVLTGAATFNMETYSDKNGHYMAIALANSIKNAALNLGRKFGANLNEGDTFVNPIKQGGKMKGLKQSVLLKPDTKIMQQYITAIQNKDQETIDKLVRMYDIKISNDVA